MREGEDTLSLASVDVYDGSGVVVTARYTANDSSLTYIDRAIEGTTEVLYRSDDGQDSTRISFIGRYDGSEGSSYVETVYFLSTGFGTLSPVSAPPTPVKFGLQNPLRPGATIEVASALPAGRVTYQLVGVDGRVLTLSPQAGRLRLPTSLPGGAYVLAAAARGYSPYARPVVIQ